MFDVTLHPVDENWLSATYVAAVDGKQVGAEMQALAPRYARRKLFKSISDCYKQAALKVLRDAPGFAPGLYVWGRPYFILHKDSEAAIDDMVELETLRDTESVFDLFQRQLTPLFRPQRKEIEALVKNSWREDALENARAEASAVFQKLVARATDACFAAEETSKSRAGTVLPRRKTGQLTLRPRYDPPAFVGLSPRSMRKARLVEASEILSYNGILWMSKITPLWQQSQLMLTISDLADIYPAVREMTGPPCDLFEVARGRFAHVNAAMALELDNNYSVGRFVPASKTGDFIVWLRRHKDEIIERTVTTPFFYQKLLEAALYAHVKNWSLVEASDVLMPFTDQLP